MEVPDPVAGKIHVAGKMFKFSRTPMVVGSAPVEEEHTGRSCGAGGCRGLGEHAQGSTKSFWQQSL